MKKLDKVQIVGFIISAIVSIVLLIVGEDTIRSITLGFVLAVFTQLLDLQKRYSESEERILEANALDQKLYSDKELLPKIQQIVRDYITVKNSWFDMYRMCADDVLNECNDTFRALASGELVTQRTSPYSIGAEAFSLASRSVITVITQDVEMWRGNSRTEKYLSAFENAIQRGVNATRVFITPKKKINDVIDIFEIHQEVGVDVQIVESEDLPIELHEDFILIDDRIVSRMEYAGDGRVRVERISIDPTDIERMTNKYDIIMRYAKPLSSLRN